MRVSQFALQPLFRIFFFFLPLLSTPLYANSDSFALELIDTSSIFDLLRYSIGLQNSPEGILAEEKAILLFLEVAGSHDAHISWNLLSCETKKSLISMIKSGIHLLITEEPLFQDNLKDQLYTNFDNEIWNTYLTLTKNLKNRALKGFIINRSSDLIEFQHDQIDLGRALSLEFDSAYKKYSIAEIALDILAADVQSRRRSPSSHNKTPIELINELLFSTLKMRFPPHEQSEQQIDRFSDIQKIIVSKRGVCLGVSSMYIAILQRIGISYNIYTPPGHIFLTVEEQQGEKTYERVIETTARGVHLPIDTYLSAKIAYLTKRNTIEIVGMTLMNNAAKMLQERAFDAAISLYVRAESYIFSEKKLLNTFLSLALLSGGQKKEGKKRALFSVQVIQNEVLDSDPVAFDIAFSQFDNDTLHLFIDSIASNRSFDKKALEEKLHYYLQKSSSSEWSISLAYLFVELSILSGKYKEAFSTLETCYNNWIRIHNKNSQYMGLPQLITLSKLAYQEVDIRKAVEYAKEAFFFAHNRISLIEKEPSFNRAHITIPDELHNLLMFFTQKSPGCLNKGIIL